MLLLMLLLRLLLLLHLLLMLLFLLLLMLHLLLLLLLHLLLLVLMDVASVVSATFDFSTYVLLIMLQQSLCTSQEQAETA